MHLLELVVVDLLRLRHLLRHLLKIFPRCIIRIPEFHEKDIARIAIGLVG